MKKYIKGILMFSAFLTLFFVFNTAAQTKPSKQTIKSYFSPNITQEVVAYLVNDLGLYIEWGERPAYACAATWPKPQLNLKNIDVKQKAGTQDNLAAAPQDDSVHCPPYETGCLIDLLNWCPDAGGNTICNEEGCTCVVGC